MATSSILSPEQCRGAFAVLRHRVETAAEALDLDRDALSAFLSTGGGLGEREQAELVRWLAAREVYPELGPDGWEGLSWRTRNGPGFIGPVASNIVQCLARGLRGA